MLSGEPHIDRPAVTSFLARLKYPRHYLDFETIGPTIPMFDGTSPFEAVPFQYSLHIQQAPGAELEHHGYLAGGAVDPRREFMERLRPGMLPKIKASRPDRNAAGTSLLPRR